MWELMLERARMTRIGFDCVVHPIRGPVAADDQSPSRSAPSMRKFSHRMLIYSSLFGTVSRGMMMLPAWSRPWLRGRRK